MTTSARAYAPRSNAANAAPQPSASLLPPPDRTTTGALQRVLPRTPTTHTTPGDHSRRLRYLFCGAGRCRAVTLLQLRCGIFYRAHHTNHNSLGPRHYYLPHMHGGILSATTTSFSPAPHANLRLLVLPAWPRFRRGYGPTWFVTGAPRRPRGSCGLRPFALPPRAGHGAPAVMPPASVTGWTTHLSRFLAFPHHRHHLHLFHLQRAASAAPPRADLYPTATCLLVALKAAFCCMVRCVARRVPTTTCKTPRGRIVALYRLSRRVSRHGAAGAVPRGAIPPAALRAFCSTAPLPPYTTLPRVLQHSPAYTSQ